MTTIITKNSSTASAVPSAGSLVQGELAVNVTDKKLYIKDNTGAVVVLASSTSATDAAASASAAASSASAAATSAFNASTSATAAASAKTAAEAARDATLAAYDNFDDRYLGTKTSDPTVDNDGNTLVAGTLYFNSVSQVMRLYTGSAWVAAYVSGADYLSKVNNLSDLTNTATARANLGVAIGSNVQAWDADLDTWATKTAPSGTVVGTSDTQTLTNKTISGASNTLSNIGLSSLSATGTPSSSTYLRGDNTWSSIASGGMTLLATLAPSAGVSSVAATGLASYKSIIAVTDTIVLTGIGYLTFAVSSDNGSTYSTGLPFTLGGSTAPTGFVQVFRTDNASSNKVGFTAFYSGGGDPYARITTVTGVVNAVRIQTSANFFTASGAIYIYGVN